MNLVFQALKFATKAHEGQTRKMSGNEYITHPIKVSYLLASYKTKSKNYNHLLAAALLHDTIEDCEVTHEDIKENFGELVASIVRELTNDSNEIKKIGKLEYMKKKMIGMSSYSLTIKLVDRLANITDLPTEKMKKDTNEIISYLESKRNLTKTQLKIVEDIKRELK